MAANSESQTTNDLLFSDRKDKGVAPTGKSPSQALAWKIMVIDDEQVVHDVSELVLRNFSYKNRRLEFVHGHSGKDAIRLIKEHPDTAIILLDVVMESDIAGLDAVKEIRETVKNKTVRIILRTGQPGQAPEHKVVRLYDINDYLDKGKLTSQYLEIALITSLRAYDDINTIGQLTETNDTLDSLVKSRTKDLYEANTRLKQKMKEQVTAHQTLQLSEARLAEAQRIARVGHFEWQNSTDCMSWSDQICRIFKINISAEMHTFEDFLSFVAKEDRQIVEQTMRNALKSKLPYELEHKIRLDSDEQIVIHQQGDILTDQHSRVEGLVGTIRDVTEKRLAEIEMKKLSTVVEQVSDSIMITDAAGVIEYVNPAMSRMTGYSKEELVGQTPRILKSDQQSKTFYARMWAAILKGKIFSEVVINKHKDGHIFYEEKTITPQKDSQGLLTNFISSGRDITERIEAQKRLHHLAHHDGLTGLPNRILLQDRLEQAIARARWRKRKVAVLFLDIDRFKVINDSLGHHVGDLLLQEMAERLSACVREGDTVARFGGDEFTIILNDISQVNDISLIADKILADLALPHVCDSRELFITASIGISLFPSDADNSQTLLKKADTAMYIAKRFGKNIVRFYAEEDESLSVERLTLESELRRALERKEFVLYYQPQLSLSSCKIKSYEALIRWQNPTRGLITPFHFLDLLEETGMIIEVGKWVLNQACTQEKSNQDQGLQPKRVAVNISAKQFSQKDFVSVVEHTLTQTGLKPEYLELEVTEGTLIENIDDTAKKLEELHAQGVSLSIDDFGTGYSSMNYLRRLPFDTLKIDRSFVSEVTTNKDDGAIAAAIITLAHSIGLDVVAEGVETMEQLIFLDNLGCDMIQGYLCTQPLPASKLESIEDDCYIGWKSQLKNSEL